MKTEFYRNREIEDVDLQERPRSLENVSGYPSVGRFGSGESTRTNLFKTVIVDEFEVSLTFDAFLSAYTGTHEYEHELGFVPFVMLAARHPTTNDYIEIPGRDNATWAVITNKTNKIVELTFQLEFANRFKVVIYLLEPPV